MPEMLLVLAVVIDGFTVCFVYGASRILIPFRSALTMALIGTGMLLVSLTAADAVGKFLPVRGCQWLGFWILLLLGVGTLLQRPLKGMLQQVAAVSLKKRWGFSHLLSVCLDETNADADGSKVLTVREAVTLGVALSVDSLATGFGSGLTEPKWLPVALMAPIFHLAAIYGGLCSGSRLSKGTKMLHLEWMGGLILVALAIFRLWKI